MYMYLRPAEGAAVALTNTTLHERPTVKSIVGIGALWRAS